MISFVRPLKHFAGICLFLLFSHSSFAELKANFTVDNTGGCSPLAVSFTNTTTGASSSVKYKWDFGNGNTSTLVNPGATFKDEKTYTVTLTATDGAQTSVKKMDIVVYITLAIRARSSGWQSREARADAF